MRKLLVLLLLILSALWLYASWYWYTCMIKGFCSATEVVMVDDTESQSEDAFSDNSPEPVAPVVIESTPEVVEEVIISEEKPREVEEVVEKQTTPEPVVEIQQEATAQPIVEEAKKECETLIVTSIKLGAQNDTGDVKDLQDFLNAFEGESLEVDGLYNQDDIEAVKRFQTKYASDILTPWGIQNPTGYVYKTTTEKINDIYCGK